MHNNCFKVTDFTLSAVIYINYILERSTYAFNTLCQTLRKIFCYSYAELFPAYRISVVCYAQKLFNLFIGGRTEVLHVNRVHRHPMGRGRVKVVLVSRDVHQRLDVPLRQKGHVLVRGVAHTRQLALHEPREVSGLLLRHNFSCYQFSFCIYAATQYSTQNLWLTRTRHLGRPAQAPGRGLTRMRTGKNTAATSGTRVL